MDYRNPKYNALGTIDCEIDHPVYGWIPFTASPDDPEEHGRVIYELVSKGSVAPYVHPILEVASPDRVSARQFKLQLLAAGLLDQVETWVSAQSRAVQIAYGNSAEFIRTENTMQHGFAELGLTSVQIDAFFVAASAL